MQLLVGKFSEDGDDFVFKWIAEYRSRPEPCFNCGQDIKVEQDRWNAVYGADNNAGVDLRVELWKLPSGVAPISGFENVSELITAYSVRDGRQNRLLLAGTRLNFPNRVASREERDKAQILALLKAYAPQLKRQRDFQQQLAKLKDDSAAAEILTELA